MSHLALSPIRCFASPVCTSVYSVLLFAFSLFRICVLLLFRTSVFFSEIRYFAHLLLHTFIVAHFNCFVLSLFHTFVVLYLRCFALALLRIFVVSLFLCFRTFFFCNFGVLPFVLVCVSFLLLNIRSCIHILHHCSFFNICLLGRPTTTMTIKTNFNLLVEKTFLHFKKQPFIWDNSLTVSLMFAWIKLVWCWYTIYDAGPTLSLLVNVSYLVGSVLVDETPMVISIMLSDRNRKYICPLPSAHSSWDTGLNTQHLLNQKEGQSN